MHWYVLFAGVLALVATVGHFTMGTKSYLRPMLAATFDDVPKQVIRSEFHYVSAYLLLSTIVLIAAGIGFNIGVPTNATVQFIAANFVVFAIVQVFIALTSPVPNLLSKMFQWVFWLGIGALAWVGVALG